MRFLLRVLSYVVAAGIGFAAGIYVLPIITAPEAPTTEELQASVSSSEFTAEFRRDLKGSDALHWGEGTVYVSAQAIALDGEIAPGPDYRLYLSPEFVETEAEFNRVKPRMVQVGDVKTFENFIVTVPPGIDPEDYTSVIVWCESFGQFITAGRYRR